MLLDKINFALQGSLIDLISRQIPNFSRPSPVWLERTFNEAVQLYPIAAYHPAIYEDGSFLLEPERRNLLTWCRDLSQSVWIKGSKVIVYPDEVLSADGKSQADKVAFVGGTGNDVTLKRSLTLSSNTDYVFSIILSQSEGSVSNVQDVIQIKGAVVGSPSITIESLNSTIGKYRILEIPFKTIDTTNTVLVSLEFYIPSTVVLNISGMQIEAGFFRSSFILQDEEQKTRQASSLIYRKNPTNDLKNCGIFVSVLDWKGDGNIINTGDISLVINNSKLLVTVNGSAIAVNIDLPKSFKVFVQVSQENLNFSVYLNGILRVRQTISNFSGGDGLVALTSTGIRRIGMVIFTDKTLIELQKTLGGAATDEVFELFNNPVILDSAVISFDPPLVILPEVNLPAKPNNLELGGSSIRFPFTPNAQQEILSINTPNRKLTVNATSSFVAGRAFIHTYLYEDIAEIEITAIDNTSKTITLNSVVGVSQGDFISQPASEMLVDPANYYCGLLTPLEGVSIHSAHNNGLIISNRNSATKKCSPYIRVYL